VKLAGFRAGETGARSVLYVDLDPSESPTPGAVETRVNSDPLRSRSGSSTSARAQLPRPQREALKGGSRARITAWFNVRLRPATAPGASGVFAAGLDNFWSTLSLSEPVKDDVEDRERASTSRPLARLVGRSDDLPRRCRRSRARRGVPPQRWPPHRDRGTKSEGRAGATRPGRLVAGALRAPTSTRIVERHWRRVADTFDGLPCESCRARTSCSSARRT